MLVAGGRPWWDHQRHLAAFLWTKQLWCIPLPSLVSAPCMVFWLFLLQQGPQTACVWTNQIILRLPVSSIKADFLHLLPATSVIVFFNFVNFCAPFCSEFSSSYQRQPTFSPTNFIWCALIVVLWYSAVLPGDGLSFSGRFWPFLSPLFVGDVGYLICSSRNFKCSLVN